MNNTKVYEMVTNNIIAQLEKGTIPWIKGWTHGSRGRVSHSTGKPYSLINQLMLPLEGEYLTFKQIQDEGGKVKKGEKASFVVFWKWLEVESGVEDENGKPVMKKIPYLKYYNVFHISQCEGIEPKYTKPVDTFEHEPIKVAESLIKHYIDREKIAFCCESLSNDAFYNPCADAITIPTMKQFSNINEYYSTAFHEMTHSTGHEKRLNRKLVGNTAKSRTDYSKEELVAEIGSAMLCNTIGINTEFTDSNSTAYVQGWLKALKNDVKMVVSASGKAEKSCDFILDGFEYLDDPDNDPKESTKDSTGVKVNKGVNSAMKSLISPKKPCMLANTMFEVNGFTYVCNGHVAIKTSETTEFRHDDAIVNADATLDKMFESARKVNAYEVIIPEHKEFKKALAEYKKSTGAKKVAYMLSVNGKKICFDAKYLEIALHCGVTKATGNNPKSPILAESETTTAIILPIILKDYSKHDVGTFFTL